LAGSGYPVEFKKMPNYQDVHPTPDDSHTIPYR
jgi:hypothetical protein